VRLPGQLEPGERRPQCRGGSSTASRAAQPAAQQRDEADPDRGMSGGGL
jgi:hypothetical protein